MRYPAIAVTLVATTACNSLLGIDDVEHAKSGAGAENSNGGAGFSGGSHENEANGGIPAIEDPPTGGDSGSAGEQERGGSSGELASSGSTGTSSDAGTSSGNSGDCNAAGTLQESAYDFHQLGLLASCYGAVVDAKGDYYRFELSENSVLTYTLAPTTGRLVGSFYRDATQIDTSSPLFTADTTSTSITARVNLEKGVYYLRTVGPPMNVLYALELGAAPYSPSEPTPEPGEDKNHALELGEVGELKTVAGYVGVTDAEDYYRIEAPSNLTAIFSLDNVNGQAKYQIYEDSAQVDLSAPRWESGWANDKNNAYREIVLEKRAYLVRITTSNPPLGSLYTLKVSVKGS